LGDNPALAGIETVGLQIGIKGGERVAYFFTGKSVHGIIAEITQQR
jgi:hypothetical protein